MSDPNYRPATLPPTMEDLHFRNFDSEDEINVFTGSGGAAGGVASGLGSSPSSASPDIPTPLPRFKPDTTTVFGFPEDPEHELPVPESDIGDMDTEQLLGSGEKSGNASFWTFEYYQQFFEVSSADVARRLMGSMVPRPNVNFLQTSIRPNPDLYGPTWVAITLVFTTGICGNLSNYIASLRDPKFAYHFSFHAVNIAATAIFAYWLLVPAALHLVFWWRGARCNVTFLESLCIYGYSLAVYVPICVLWLIPSTGLQTALVVIGTVLSGSVLVMTFWPTVRDDDKRVAVAVVVAILLFHGILALGFLLYFFQRPSISGVEPTIIAPTVNATIKAVLKATTVTLTNSSGV